MGYLKIPNLYKDKRILLFNECYAMEKVHGTSCHASFDIKNNTYSLFNGGFHKPILETLYKWDEIMDILLGIYSGTTLSKITFFGEGYGGNMQKMSHIYGEGYKFIVFDVKTCFETGETWQHIDNACAITQNVGLPFVPYVRTIATVDNIDHLANIPSSVASMHGLGNDKIREGVVVRPIKEAYIDGGRVIAKHKSKAYQELQHQPSLEKRSLDMLNKAEDVANQWVTYIRLLHVLDKYPQEKRDINIIKEVIDDVLSDVKAESEGEIDWSNTKTPKAIKNKAALLYKEYLCQT